MKFSQSCPTLRPHGLYSPWDSPGQNTGVGSLLLLQGKIPTQGLNPGLLHCRQILYQLSHKGSPILECKVKWALGSITSNKASGGDGIPVELFQILKDDAVKVLHSLCQLIWKTQQWAQDWKRLVFIPIPKKGNAKECSNYRTIALISHASKVMLKILQARLQQYMNCEDPDVQAGFRKDRRTRDQIAKICWIIKKAREFQKDTCLCFIDYAKAFDCVDQNKLWKILKEMGIPDHLTCLLRNLYAGQEATVNWTWNNRLVPNRKTSTSRRYIVTLLI